MKKLFVLAALSLVASVAFSQDVPPGAVLLGDLFIDGSSPAPPGVQIEFLR